MKTKLTWFVLAAFMLICAQMKSQTFEVPKNYAFKVKEDYAKYEKDVVACVNWLESSPLDENPQKRAEANNFFIAWLTGSPSVNILINIDILGKYFNRNPNFSILFMGGWTRYVLEHNYDNGLKTGCLEGLSCVIRVYKKGVGVTRNKDLDKLVKIYDKGGLEKWVDENVK